ncbi:hypothetical protein V6N13_065235 [Hibiscus sabdariffa]
MLQTLIANSALAHAIHSLLQKEGMVFVVLFGTVATLVDEEQRRWEEGRFREADATTADLNGLHPASTTLDD